MEKQSESAPKAEVASINDLPDEMLCEIFSHLCDIKDVLNTRLVCFKWNEIHRTFMQLNKLTLTECPIEQMCLSERIETIENCPKKLYNFFLDGRDWAIFAEKQIELVNNLKFVRISLARREYDFLKFDLPNLEIFLCESLNYENDIEINSPKLRELLYRERYTKESALRVVYPLSVKKLNTDLMGAFVRKKENLEDLTTDQFKTLKQVDQLPKLKRVCFDHNFYSFSWREEEVLEKILDRKPRGHFELAPFTNTPGNWFLEICQVSFQINSVHCFRSHFNFERQLDYTPSVQRGHPGRRSRRLFLRSEGDKLRSESPTVTFKAHLLLLGNRYKRQNAKRSPLQIVRKFE